MAKIRYEDRKFRADRLELIGKVNAILLDYQSQGFTMTLRQVYYQLVKANKIPNNERSYENLGSLITDGRRAGLIDWALMEDRTRNLRSTSAWERTRDMIANCRHWYNYPKWANQKTFLEGWIEKDALLGVLERPCAEWDIPYFACRGYMSDIEQHSAAQRAKRRYRQKAQATVILHFGDHDPSGIDMTRDIQDRFHYFGCGQFLTVRRMALNMAQINQYQPPPNPAKLTDSRSTGYIDKFGGSSWELDALTPTVIAELVNAAVDEYRDVELWDEALAMEKAGTDQMAALHERWEEVEDVIGTQESFLPETHDYSDIYTGDDESLDVIGLTERDILEDG